MIGFPAGGGLGTFDSSIFTCSPFFGSCFEACTACRRQDSSLRPVPSPAREKEGLQSDRGFWYRTRAWAARAQAHVPAPQAAWQAPAGWCSQFQFQLQFQVQFSCVTVHFLHYCTFSAFCNLSPFLHRRRAARRCGGDPVISGWRSGHLSLISKLFTFCSHERACCLLSFCCCGI